MNTVYLVAIQGMHGADITRGNDCLFASYEAANCLLKAYHANGQTYMKMFYLTLNDTVPSWIETLEAKGVAKEAAHA